MNEQNNEQAVPVEFEGDRNSWWYVCGECHGPVNPREEYCPGCQSRLDWRMTVL